MVKSRRNRNRASRRASRKACRTAHRSRKNRTYRGGNAPVNAASVDPSVVAQSLAQGRQFVEMKGQTGGVAPLAAVTAAPLLTPNEAASARTAVLDKYISEISGMQDGGRRRRKGRKASRKGRKTSRKASRKGRKASRKGHKGRKASRKTRRYTMRGGVAEVNANTMLLNNYKDAGLNPEWREVQGNPMAYAPK
jgi:hypothetical protein